MDWAVFTIGLIGILIVIGFLVGRAQKPRTQQPQTRPLDPAALRRERIAAAQKRAAEAEEQATTEETILIYEEDADYYRQLTREVRTARQQRRQRPQNPPQP